MSDSILQKARQAKFHFDEDASALYLLKVRLAEKARQQPDDVIVYSELVRGIQFRLPTVQGGMPIELGVPEWFGLHQSIIGGCLGRISRDSYIEGGFLASAVAVSKATFAPSDGFNVLLEQLGFVGSRSDPKCTDLWVEHLRETYRWCREHPKWPEP